jgi:UTP--glucose-1-phosphate uridylyltransferase
LGTRLQPLTKYVPKELLPVGEKPMLQHVVEMYLASGISEFCFVTSPDKPLIRDFITGAYPPRAFPFKPDTRFYNRLRACRVLFCSQNAPQGVAHAIWLAKDFVGSEPFACIMPDCLLFSENPFLQQLMEAFSRHGKNTIGAVVVHCDEAKRYGNVGILRTKPVDDSCFLITSITDKTEKPLPVERGENIQKGFGGGIYLPEYFRLVETIRPKAGREVDDVPIHDLLVRDKNLLGVPLRGAAFDAGHPLGFRAAVHFVGRPHSET